MVNRASLPLAPCCEAHGMNLGAPGPHPIVSGPHSAAEGEELHLPILCPPLTEAGGALGKVCFHRVLRALACQQLLLSSIIGTEVCGAPAVEKCCIKAANIQRALQMKRFFICVLKEEK